MMTPRNSRRRVETILFAALVLLGGHSTNAQQHRSSFEALKRYAGDYENSKVLGSPVVRRPLATLVGKRNLDKIDHYTLVQGPIDLIDGDMAIAGCAPHECSDKAAIVILDTANDIVHAAIMENETITIYSSEHNFKFLPTGLTKWIRDRVDYARVEFNKTITVRFN